jgi:hypothetical protein
MRISSVLIAAAAAVVLSACAAVSAVGTAASVAGSVVSTTVEVTGDVIGGAARTVTGSSDSSDSKSK